MHIVILVIWLLLLSFLLWLAFLTIKAHHPTRRRTPRNHSTSRNVSPKKWQQLLTLVQGDVATASRLIDRERRRNPHRSMEWCIEKAIWDLERDRH
ncbi:hypothetical protein CEN50_22785 [Fischerella thermalis CCMEE 5268]|uniref:Uncharacterized protein n=1 Tax=Fischerella thermalis CCMEE 5268 TaxID=2019662 RepID=A0A2N6KAF5_9CYAN|nr:hypothetical protein [Fischerella thermalis]PLZ95300.1 hypothetical protein CEN50_22785 [Fischerella thermalis CCMEE 5268]